MKASTRLRKTLELMNAYRREKLLDVPRVADLLNAPTVQQLQEYFSGEEEPPLSFLDQYSSFFGVNPDWLKNGDNSPFTSTERWMNKAFGYFDRILQIAPSEVTFVLEKATYHTCIVLHISEHKSLLLPSIWSVIAWRGDGGLSDIANLHRLMTGLIGSPSSASRVFHGQCTSCVIEDSLFRELTHGLLCPVGFSISTAGNYNIWHFDFMDIFHRRYSPEHYKEQYCADFVQAQLQVRGFAPDLYEDDR
jgi:hypothetical protein